MFESIGKSEYDHKRQNLRTMESSQFLSEIPTVKKEDAQVKKSEVCFAFVFKHVLLVLRPQKSNNKTEIWICKYA